MGHRQKGCQMLRGMARSPMNGTCLMQGLMCFLYRPLSVQTHLSSKQFAAFAVRPSKKKRGVDKIFS